MVQTEAQLQEQVAQYLRLQYPGVLFHSDFGSGVKLTPGQAAKQKRQNGGRRGWPDMFIAEPKVNNYDVRSHDDRFVREVTKGEWEDKTDMRWFARCFYCGLFIELKSEGTRLKKKNGEWATPHIAEQAKVLLHLRQRGYVAEFAVGFDEAKKIIDEYLK